MSTELHDVGQEVQTARYAGRFVLDMGSTATGLGSVFNDRSEDKFGFIAQDDDKW